VAAAQALALSATDTFKVRRVNKIADAWKNWQIKAFAIIQSSFSEVLYMDSDNIPLRDPTTLFDAPHYLNNGQAAFWPDINKDHPSNAIWRIIDEPCSLDEWTFESGQIVINKAGNSGLNLAALHLAAGMLDDHNRDFWLRISGGDKDTFRWGFRILDIPYAASPQFLTAVGFLESNNAFCGHTSLQHDLTPTPGTNTYAPLFVHSNLLKHMGGWGFGSSGSNIYSYAKHMAVNAAGEPSLNTYPTITRDGGIRGLCLDVKGDSKETAADGENYVVLERLDDMPGHPFQGFVDRWFAAGGHPGGW
jgi:alpha 1,2-mannosyltransferase